MYDEFFKTLHASGSAFIKDDFYEYAGRAVKKDDKPQFFAKLKGGKEFATELSKNNTLWETIQGGNLITEKEYNTF